jgi:hypothetical protein
MTEISHILSGDDDLLVYLLGQKKLPVAFCLKPEGWGTTRIPGSLREFVIQRRRHHSAGKFYGRRIQLGYLLYHLSNLFLWVLPLFQPYLLLVLVFKIGLDYALLLRLGSIFRERVSLFNQVVFEAGYLLHHIFIAPLAFLGKIRWR